MWIRWCVLARAECFDGKTKESEFICCQWCSSVQRCLMIEQASLSVDFYYRTLMRMDEVAAETHKGQEDVAAELEANLPEARELGRSLPKKREDSEAQIG